MAARPRAWSTIPPVRDQALAHARSFGRSGSSSGVRPWGPP